MRAAAVLLSATLVLPSCDGPETMRQPTPSEPAPGAARTPSATQPPAAAGGRDCRSDPRPAFTALPTEPDALVQVSPPLMRVGSGIKGHAYLEVTRRAQVFAPATATLVAGAKYREPEAPGLVQYLLHFEVSCEVTYYFDHVIEPPPHIAALFPGEPKADTRTDRVQPTRVEAGATIGRSWGEGRHRFDLGVMNTTKRTVLAADPQHASSDKYAHADCPVAYYEGERRRALAALLGHRDFRDLVLIDDLCAGVR